MKKRNLFKKSLSVMLALLMVLSTLVIIPMASADETDDLPEAYDGMSLDYSWYLVEGAGTADKPYEIATAAQLAAWSALTNAKYTPADINETAETPTAKTFANAHVVLTADINYGGQTLSSLKISAQNADKTWPDNPLTFDGQGHTIYNLNTSSFFKGLSANSTVKNVNFVGAYSTSTALVVENCDTYNVLFENIVIDETSTVKGGGNWAGSIVCMALVGTDGKFPAGYTREQGTMTVRNCYSAATVTSVAVRGGGLVASFQSPDNLVMENCVYAGTYFLKKGNYAPSFGAMLGYAVNTSGANHTFTFKNCVNGATLTNVDGETLEKGGAAASGVACIADSANSKVFVENCYDLGVRNVSTSASFTNYAVKTALGSHAANITPVVTYSYGVAQKGVTFADAENVVPSFDTTIEVAPFTYSTVAEEVLEIMAVFTGVNLKDAFLDLIAWDGMTFDYSWYKVSGAGTAEKPYEIDSAAALAAWSALSNGTYNPGDLNETEATAKVFNDKYFVLTADINMGGNPILPITAGKWTSVEGNQIWDPAAGSGLTFDGQGYTIYNLSINAKNATHDGQALFGSIGRNTTIKNLKFVGANVGKGVGGWQPASIVAAYATGDGLVMENIFIDDTSVVDANRIAGSLAAYVLDRDASKTFAPATFKNCVSYATIKTDGLRSAGLLGCHIQLNGVFNFENCVYGGDFELKAGGITNTEFGGIIGITMDVSSTLNFKNCVCTANIYTPEGVTLAQPARIVGISNTGNPGKGTQTQTFENCIDLSTKNVTSTAAVSCYVLTLTKFEFTATNCGGITNGVTHVDTDYVIDAITPEIEAQIDALSAALMFEYVAFNGEGTEASPLVIATAEDLYKYAVNYNLFTEKTYITVTADIEVGDYVFDPIAATVEVVVTADNKTVTFPCTVADPAKAIFAEGVSASVTGVTPAVADHDFEFACSAECAVCGKANTAAAAHTTDGACDLACNVCGAATGNTAAHTYDHNCDADCNVCGEGREVDGHAYDGACDEECNNCGTPNAGATAHLWENDCDAECNVCGKDRDAGHTYDGDCDTSCNGCGEARMDTAAHTYDNDQDASCNVCGATRKVTTPDTPAGDKPADDKDETTAAADEETTAKETVKADTTEPAADEGCASSVAGIGALLALTASFGFALVGKKKED